MNDPVPCDVMYTTESLPIIDTSQPGVRIVRFHLEEMDDPGFLWCDSQGNRGTEEKPSLLVGISLVPVVPVRHDPTGKVPFPPTPDEEIQRGALYLDLTLDEVRGFQAQLQRLIDDNAQEEA